MLVKLQSTLDKLVREIIKVRRLYVDVGQDATRSQSDGLECRSFVGKVAVTFMMVSNLHSP
jgi:hypothetical protein